MLSRAELLISLVPYSRTIWPYMQIRGRSDSPVKEKPCGMPQARVPGTVGGWPSRWCSRPIPRPRTTRRGAPPGGCPAASRPRGATRPPSSAAAGGTTGSPRCSAPTWPGRQRRRSRPSPVYRSRCTTTGGCASATTASATGCPPPNCTPAAAAWTARIRAGPGHRSSRPGHRSPRRRRGLCRAGRQPAAFRALGGPVARADMVKKSRGHQAWKYRSGAPNMPGSRSLPVAGVAGAAAPRGS